MGICATRAHHKALLAVYLMDTSSGASKRNEMMFNDSQQVELLEQAKGPQVNCHEAARHECHQVTTADKRQRRMPNKLNFLNKLEAHKVATAAKCQRRMPSKLNFLNKLKAPK